MIKKLMMKRKQLIIDTSLNKMEKGDTEFDNNNNKNNILIKKIFTKIE